MAVTCARPPVLLDAGRQRRNSLLVECGGGDLVASADVAPVRRSGMQIHRGHLLRAGAGFNAEPAIHRRPVFECRDLPGRVHGSGSRQRRRKRPVRPVDRAGAVPAVGENQPACTERDAHTCCECEDAMAPPNARRTLHPVHDPAA